MLVELPPTHYPIALPLLSAFADHLIVAAALERTSPAAIFVDDPANPAAVFAATAEGHFLAGDATNPALVEAIHAVIVERVWRRYAVIPLYPAGDGWLAELPRIFGRPPILAERVVYCFDRPHPSPLGPLPTGFTLLTV